MLLTVTKVITFMQVRLLLRGLCIIDAEYANGMFLFHPYPSILFRPTDTR